MGVGLERRSCAIHTEAGWECRGGDGTECSHVAKVLSRMCAMLQSGRHHATLQPTSPPISDMACLPDLSEPASNHFCQRGAVGLGLPSEGPTDKRHTSPDVRKERFHKPMWIGRDMQQPPHNMQ